MSQNEEKDAPSHFKGRPAIEHVIEAQVQGILSSAEIHGTEIPGHISSFADAARETAILFTILSLILSNTSISLMELMWIFAIFSLALTLWKGGRSGWLAWSRLERMDRIVEQERWEIQHHRSQEREELKDLYRAKGFEGKLLEDVMDVLMADEERLLRVMVEEELCLSLGTQEHPLKQAFWAAMGVVGVSFICILLYFCFPNFGIMVGGLGSLAIASAISAYYEGNRIVPAIIWNLGLSIVACGSVYYLMKYIYE